jgi:hypothetical protein
MKPLKFIRLQRVLINNFDKFIPVIEIQEGGCAWDFPPPYFLAYPKHMELYCGVGMKPALKCISAEQTCVQGYIEYWRTEYLDKIPFMNSIDEFVRRFPDSYRKYVEFPGEKDG